MYSLMISLQEGFFYIWKSLEVSISGSRCSCLFVTITNNCSQQGKEVVISHNVSLAITMEFFAWFGACNHHEL